MQEESHEVVVHVLHEGYPLCNFTRKLPSDWPQVINGHGHTCKERQRVKFVRQWLKNIFLHLNLPDSFADRVLLDQFFIHKKMSIIKENKYFMTDFSFLVSPVTNQVFSFAKKQTILVNSVTDFFAVEAILQEHGFSNLLKDQIIAISDIQSRSSQEELQLLLETIEVKEKEVKGIEDDFETPLIEYLLSYPEIVTRNYFGVREVFHKEDETVYIIKMYLLRAQLEDEYVTLSHYAFSKVYAYFAGQTLHFPKGLNQDSFVTFWKEERIDEMMHVITQQTFSEQQIQEVFTTYLQEEKNHEGELLLDDTHTQRKINEIFFLYLDEAKKSGVGIFSIPILAPEEIQNRLELIAKYLQIYLQQIQDSTIFDLMILNDFDTVVNASLMYISSQFPQVEKREEIKDVVVSLDEKKQDISIGDEKQKKEFFVYYIERVNDLLSNI